MSRYIEVNELLKHAHKAVEVDEAGFMATFHTIDVAEVGKIPTANVKPVVHGEWIEGHYGIECSNCGREAVYREGDDGRWHYEYFCPNCGADMR